LQVLIVNVTGRAEKVGQISGKVESASRNGAGLNTRKNNIK
jgi:hypothetical protein